MTRRPRLGDDQAAWIAATVRIKADVYSESGSR